MSVVVHSARLVDDGTLTDHAWVRFDGERIAATGTGDGWQAHALPGDRVLDATAVAGRGAVLTPGFIDIHGHGGGGASYDDGPDAIRTARDLHRAHGTTRAVVSLVTASADAMERRVAMVADLVTTDADILGSHLEGPFLARDRRGAHDPSLLRDPAREVVARLLAAGGGTVRQVTIAPELPGGLDAIRAIVAAGSAAAIGHTSAGAALCAAAFDAGATILTHAFNAMPGLHHRAPGPVGAAASDPRVTLELIADGVHVHPAVLRIAFASAAGRIALVTDAMAAAGAGDGTYDLGGLEVGVVDGVARLAGGDTIAGSTATQDAALRVCVAAGVALPAAVHALTAAPASAIGRGGDLGRFRPGFLADAVLLDADLRVHRVWTAGRAEPGGASDARTHATEGAQKRNGQAERAEPARTSPEVSSRLRR